MSEPTEGQVVDMEERRLQNQIDEWHEAESRKSRLLKMCDLVAEDLMSNGHDVIGMDIGDALASIGLVLIPDPELEEESIELLALEEDLDGPF